MGRERERGEKGGAGKGGLSPLYLTSGYGPEAVPFHRPCSANYADRVSIIVTVLRDSLDNTAQQLVVVDDVEQVKRKEVAAKHT